MSKKFAILVGTMTGTAYFVAQEIAAVLTSRGASVEEIDMGGLTPTVLTPDRDYIICTSTYGSGDVPDNARDFFDALENERPDLSQIRFAVFGLGDSTYQQTFGFGGIKFDELFGALGAQRLDPVQIHNASGGTMPEDECVPWIEQVASEAMLETTAS